MSESQIMFKQIRILTYKHPFLRKLLYPAIIMRRYLINRRRRNIEILCENISDILAEDMTALDASTLKPGMYFYTIRTAENSVTKKMIVK